MPLNTLKQGDVVDLVAPASGCSEEEYKGCLKFIEGLGLTPNARDYADLVKAEEEFCSNSIDYRFEHLHRSLVSYESKAVWCISGGYGSYQLLEKLDKIPAPAQEKLFIGFSDITVLLNYFINKWNWKCVHGPMLAQIARGSVSDGAVANVRKLIFGEEKSVKVELAAINEVAKRNGERVGKLIGGCLSLMQVFIGTKQHIDTRGKVLLLEDDRFETPERISRIVDHMQRAGIFNEVSAVIFGDFLEDDINNIDRKRVLDKVLNDFGREMDKKSVPVLVGKNLGHSKDMAAVPLGTFASVKLGGSPMVDIAGFN